MNAQHVIIRPIISERSMRDAANGKFTFAVDQFAKKTQVKQVVQDKFAVHVTDIATSVVKGKSKRIGPKRTQVMGSIYKKAIVTVKKGEKIALFDIAENK